MCISLSVLYLQATGLHAIDHNHASHSPTDPEMAYIWKSLACLLAVYFFYVFETLMGWFSVRFKGIRIECDHEYQASVIFYKGGSLDRPGFV